MKQQNLLPIAEAWYLRTWRNFSMDVPQVHNRLEMMYVLSGSCVMSADKEKHSMKRGDYLFVDANVPHTLATDADVDCRMLNVEYSFKETVSAYPDLHSQAVADFALAALLQKRPLKLFMKDNGDVGALLRALVLQLDSGTNLTDWLVQSLFSALHMRIARAWSETERLCSEPGERYVADTLSYLRSHYDMDFRISDAAAAINVHPAHLQRVFKRSQGMTIVAYLNRYRMEQAKMLLISTDLSVSDLCGYVGMNSRQHFSAVFKEHVGMSPVAYRNGAVKRKYAADEAVDEVADEAVDEAADEAADEAVDEVVDEELPSCLFNGMQA